jgi:hypothetical protein
MSRLFFLDGTKDQSATDISGFFDKSFQPKILR